jgi:hypothetical protein
MTSRVVWWTAGTCRFVILPLLVALVAEGLWQPAFGGFVPGGGNPAADCYGALDVRGADGSSRRIICVDGDPACDADGACQGSCTFEIAVCLNQPGAAGCTPQPLQKPARVKGAPLAVPSSQDAAPVCGAPERLEVRLRGPRQTRSATKRVRLTVVTTGSPAKDKDVAVLRCQARLDGPCPTTTTAVPTSTTTTTLAVRGAAGATIYALMPGNQLVRFSSTEPTAVTSIGTVVGLGANQTIRGIDFRPRTGQLYATTAATGSAMNGVLTTYTLDPRTAQATLVGASVALALGADLPTGYDFNPAVDRTRYVNSGDENARLNPNNGALASNDTDFSPAATTTIIAAAYDRSFDRQRIPAPPAAPLNNPIPTTLYLIDRNDSQLAIQGGINGTPSPDGGVVTDLAPLGFNLNQTNDGGFDIAPGVAGQRAFAALTDAADNRTRLYVIDLVTAVAASPVATSVGLIGDGMISVLSIAIAPEGLTVVGPDAGTEPRLTVFETPAGVPVFSFLPFGPDFQGGVRVAAGDVTGDGVPDVIASSGPGSVSQVRVFDGTTGTALPGAIGSFVPFDPSITGGVSVAAGDVNADGFDDIVVGAGAGGQPSVRVFNGRDGAQLLDFLAYEAEFTGGVHVGAGDTDLDGRAELITGPGAGRSPLVQVRSGVDGTEKFPGFLVYAAEFTGGVHVALGDVDGEDGADVITGPGADLEPQVRVLSGMDGTPRQSFFAYPADFGGGVRVGSADVDGDGRLDILAGPGPGGVPRVKAFDGLTLAEVANTVVLPPEVSTGVFVAGARQ